MSGIKRVIKILKKRLTGFVTCGKVFEYVEESRVSTLTLAQERLGLIAR